MSREIRDVDVIAEARTWLGTRWRHAQRTKGVSVDCAGVIVGTCKALGYPGRDVTTYGIIPDGRLMPTMRRNFAIASRIRPRFGQIGVFWFDRATREPQHLAILSPTPDGRLALIHGYMDVGRVVEHAMSPIWRRRLCAVFALRGMEITLPEPVLEREPSHR